MKTMKRSIALCYLIVLCTASVSFGQTSAQSLGSYAYDQSGNVQSIGPDDEGLTNLYDYDSAGRLIQFVRKNVATGVVVKSETFEYDAYGNLTKQTTNGVATSLAANASTNRLTGAVYDAAGNMLQYGTESYAFDPVGTMTQKSGTWGSAFYIYTADDERIGIEGPDHTWRYMGRDVDGKVLREWSASSWNGSWVWTEDYVYRDGQLAAAVRPPSQGGTRHFHLDHLGSPRLITNTDRVVYAEHAYYPYGREITPPTQELNLGHDTPEPMKFTGHERDFAGTYTGPVLDYMHARYYNPQAGRFLSVDPGRDWNAAHPQSWNLYAYVGNNPLLFSDPTGRAKVLVRDSKGLRWADDADDDGVADEEQQQQQQQQQQPPPPPPPVPSESTGFGGITASYAKGKGGSLTVGENDDQGFVMARAGAGYTAGVKWDPKARVPTPEDGSTPPRAFFGGAASVGISFGPYSFEFTLRTGMVAYTGPDGKLHVSSGNSAGPKGTLKMKEGFGFGIGALAGGEAGFTFDFLKGK